MKSYIKILIIALLLIIVFIFSNIIYNSFFNTNYKYLEDKVLKVVEKQDYIDFKDIIRKDWDEMYILDLSKKIDTYSNIYNIDFSTINLPYRDRPHYQLIIFYKDKEIIRYGYLGKDKVVLQIDPDKDIVVPRNNSNFNVSTDNNYRYILSK